MPDPIRISPNATVAETERLIHKIQASGSGCDILLPTNIKAYQLGGVPALIQSLITWSKKNPSGRIVTYISRQEDAERHLKNLVVQDHGLTGIVEAADVVMQDQKTSVRTQAREFADVRIEAMEASVEKAARGPKVFLLCEDATSKAFLSAFYFPTGSPDKDIRGFEDFGELARALLLRTAKFNPSAKAVPVHNANQLGIILHELFENTHLWARKECDGTWVKRSIRGLRFQLHNMTEAEFRRSAMESPPLLGYLSRLQPRPLGRHWLVEMSIFDSGPGLAQRIREGRLAIRDPITKEYDAVIDCLRLHSTSSLQSHRGIGLYLVLNMLSDLRGFLRVRTGRLALYRDFSESRYDVTPTSKEPFMLDWSSSNDTIHEYPRAEGTLLTMFVPISSE